MRFHYNGSIAPLMEGVSFLEGDIDVIADTYFEELSQYRSHSNIINEKRNLSGSLKDVINQILPFVYTPKVIFIPTKSQWVAFTNNETQAELTWINGTARKLKCRVLNVFAFINSFGKTVNGWGGGSFEHFLDNYFEPKRSLGLTWQEKWEFGQYGEPFPFEDIDKYNSRYARDRFTPEMLDKYCKEFGIDFFNENFYMPEGSKAVLIETVYKEYKGPPPISLEERRKNYGL